MELLNHLNLSCNPPEKGGILVIETKKNKGVKLLVEVKQVFSSDGYTEVVLQKGRNIYFIWDMYENGESWVWRVWNIGKVLPTVSVNNLRVISDY